MRTKIVDATIQALASVSNPRYFNSERGYQGEFYHFLRLNLKTLGVLDEIKIIIEEEYQKTVNPHVTRQRPDIILHIPREITEAPANKFNFAVWAFKLSSDQASAQEDYDKLDEMFEYLNYPLGFFINIDSDKHFLKCYDGSFPNRIIEFVVKLNENEIKISEAFWEKGEFKTDQVQ